MANQIDTDAKVIAGDDYGFGHPAIIRCSDTLMFAAHINGSDELEIHKSTNNGVDWTLKKTLTNASRFFQLISMTSTKASLVYLKNANEFEVWVTTDSGENWTNKLDITSGVDSNDKAVLLYNSGLGRLYIFSHMLIDKWTWVKYSDDDGDTWSGLIDTILNATTDIVDGDISPITNYIYISSVWQPTTYSNIITWSNSSGIKISYVELGSAGNTYHDKNLVIDSQGNRYFAYIKRTTATSKEKMVVSKNEGSEIDLFNPDSDNAIIKGSSSIGIDQDDNVYVYYTRTSDEKTYYRKYNTGTATWENAVELIGVANNRINTEKHILALSNKLHFVYYKQP